MRSVSLGPFARNLPPALAQVDVGPLHVDDLAGALARDDRDEETSDESFSESGLTRELCTQLGQPERSSNNEYGGCGVPEALRGMLFLPLVTGRRDGTGLGLALAQQIAAAHEGLLTYAPLEPGSRFTLRLPLERTHD